MEERLDDAIHILRDQAEVNALAYGWRRRAVGLGLGLGLVGHGPVSVEGLLRSMWHRMGFWAYSRVFRSDAAV